MHRWQIGRKALLAQRLNERIHVFLIGGGTDHQIISSKGFDFGGTFPQLHQGGFGLEAVGLGSNRVLNHGRHRRGAFVIATKTAFNHGIHNR